MRISVMGDSISTFESFNPDGYCVFYDAQMQYINGLTSVDDTWWAQVVQALHGELCVNNSYSGSKVSGEGFPSACSAERCGSLHTPQDSPDLILIYMGFNDFGNGVPIHGKRFSFKRDPAFFADAYECMLDRLRKNYPEVTIVYATLMRTAIGASDWPFPETYAGVPFDAYNRAIRKIRRKPNCYLADLFSFDLRYETKDGSHPTKRGHQMLADAWIRSMKRSGVISSDVNIR